MKFLFLTHIFPPATDGGSKIIAKLEEYFRTSGHQTIVLTTPHYSTDEFVKTSLKVKNLESRLNIFRVPIYHLHRRLPKPIFKIIPFFRFLVSSIQFRPNYIIAGPLPTTIVHYARLFRFVTGAKLIIVPCFHEDDTNFRTPILINTLKSADLVCTLTQHEADHLVSRFQFPASKTFLMHAGIDKSFLIQVSRIKPARRGGFPASPNILFLGNFAAHKGIETLLDAFSKLDIPATLTIAGQKTLYFPKIQQKMNSLSPSIQKRIHLYPKLYHQAQLKKYLDTATVLVLPSNHESFGLVLIEAMARGVSVIGTDIPAINELIHLTKGGLLFSPNDADDLTQKIKMIFKNPSKYTSGYQYTKNHFTWDKIGDSLWQKISSL